MCIELIFRMRDFLINKEFSAIMRGKSLAYEAVTDCVFGVYLGESLWIR